MAAHDDDNAPAAPAPPPPQQQQGALIISDRVRAAVEAQVRTACEGRDASHDFAHMERVRALALHIAALEGCTDAESLAAVELGALLHDIADHKYADKHALKAADPTAAARDAIRGVLEPLGVPARVIERVEEIATRIGFKEELPSGDAGGATAAQPPPLSLEARIVQDADRLDAIGAVGIARAFTFGGARGRPLYDPAPAPISVADAAAAAAAADGQSASKQPALTREAYAAAAQTVGAAGAGTASHFHEKLLTLQGRMKTGAGRALAARRHDFMVAFLGQLASEVRGAA